MERIKEVPVLGQIATLIDRYPRISAWIVLSAGIIILLVREAQDVGLTTSNWIALITASILVAGLCIWIVSWEDKEEEGAPSTAIKVTSEKPADLEPPKESSEEKPAE